MKRLSRTVATPLCGLALLLLAGGRLSAQSLESIKSRVRERSLANGMKFIVLERHDAPVASFHVYADVGSVNESYGTTGISHLLEHMAFKGTRTVGTKDYEKEKVLLDQLDALYDEIRAEQDRPKPDPARIEKLKADFEKARLEAQDYVAVQEMENLFLKEGDNSLNAYTSNDATQYINSLPSNRLEFWMAVTSDRFLDPVFREFYKERDVVMEERRLGLETRPMGKLFEDFMATAFKAHPYHHDVIGHMADLERIRHRDVEDYWKRFYSPANLSAAIVGDVRADEVFRLAELYFGRIPGGPRPESVRTVEPEQWGERRVIVEAQSDPYLIVGYHRPSVRDKDRYVFEAMANIIGQGRSSRLYRLLVKEKKIAVWAGSFNGWPGSKFPNLTAFFAVPAKDHRSAECLQAIDQEIEKLKIEPISEDELTKFKRSTKKQVIDSLKDNAGMAALLTGADVVLGDWRDVFDSVQRVDTVTAAEIQRVARTYLIRKNRTIGEIVPEGGK